MAATITELMARFSADVKPLQEGVAVAQKEVAKVGEKVAEVGEATDAAGKISKRSFGEIGKAAREVGTLIGGAAGEAVAFGGHIVAAGRDALSALSGVIGPAGLIAGALAAGALAWLAWSNSVEHARIASEVERESLDGLNKEIKRLKEEQEKSAIDTRELEKSADTLSDLLSRLKSDRESVRKSGASLSFLNLDAEIRGVEGQLEIVRAKLEQIGKDRGLRSAAIAADEVSVATKNLEDSLRSVSAIYDSGGNRLEYLKGELQAYKNAIEEGSRSQDVSLDQLIDWQQSIASITALIKVETDAIEGASTAQREYQAELKKTQERDERLAKNRRENVEFTQEAYNKFAESMQITSQQVYSSIRGIFNTLATGIGDAVANAIIYSENLGKSVINVLKQVAAQLISGLVALGVQWIISAIIGSTAASVLAGAQVAAQAAILYAEVFTQTAALPFGIFAAPAAATAAVTAMLAGAAIAGAAGRGVGSLVALAEGGIATAPTIALVGEAGPELVLPLSRADKLLGDLGGRGEQTINLSIGETVLRYVVRGFPRELNIQVIS